MYTFARLAVLLPALLLATTTTAAQLLPEKAFDVEDGVVALVAGVVPSPAAMSALPFGKLKYPTRYFIELRNESPYPLWIDATWTFPDKNGKSKPLRSKKIPAGGTYMYYFDKFGVIAGQPIVVDLQAWSDDKRVNLVGSQKAELMFLQADIDVFFASFPNALKGNSRDYLQSAFISGWHDLPAPRTDIHGTVADATLQADIQHTLWKSDSRKRWSCEREVLGATEFDVSDSEMLSSQPAETRQQAGLDQFGDALHMEKWTIRSCGQDIVYEVMMSASSKGGSDIAVFEVSDGQSSQNQPEVALVE